MKKYRILAGIVTAALSAAVFTVPFDAVNTASASSSNIPATSQIKDIDADGYVTTSDAQFILSFLNGNVDYAYDYSDMDVTGNGVVEYVDSQAYLNYYVYYSIMQKIEPPYSAHGALRATSESERTYKQYNFSSGTTSQYTISSLPTSSVNSREIVSGITGGNYTACYDTRLVKCNGSGFIIGAHIIATNAHCVYNSPTDTFLELEADNYVVYSYDEDGNGTAHTLTPVSVHIPTAYRKWDESTQQYTSDDRYDYALVVVEEDLSEYGFYNLGLATDNVAVVEDYVTHEYYGDGLDVIVAGFPQHNSNMIGGHRYRPLQSAGEIYRISAMRMDHTCDSLPGSSGSPIYTATSYNNTMYDSVVGIHSSPVDDNYNGGVRMQQPMLMFYLANSAIEEWY